MNIDTVRNAMFKRAGAWDTIKGWFGGSKSPYTPPQGKPHVAMDGTTVHIPESNEQAVRKPYPSNETEGNFRSGEYPYLAEREYKARLMNTHPNWRGGYPSPYFEGARIFDNELGKQYAKGVSGQKAIDAAREAQAKGFARIYQDPEANPGAYEELVQRLIQAGKANQKSFEEKGKIPWEYNIPDESQYWTPRYGESIREEYYPLMGDTTNSQRFANWG